MGWGLGARGGGVPSWRVRLEGSKGRDKVGGPARSADPRWGMERGGVVGPLPLKVHKLEFGKSGGRNAVPPAAGDRAERPTSAAANSSDKFLQV